MVTMPLSALLALDEKVYHRAGAEALACRMSQAGTSAGVLGTMEPRVLLQATEKTRWAR